MTDERERDLLAKIPTLGSLDEATGFRGKLSEQGELTGAVMVRLKERMDTLSKKEGRL